MPPHLPAILGFLTVATYLAYLLGRRMERAKQRDERESALMAAHLSHIQMETWREQSGVWERLAKQNVPGRQLDEVCNRG